MFLREMSGDLRFITVFINRMPVEVTVCVDKDEPGYHAYPLGFSGVNVGGETVEEAMKNVEDGIYLYLESIVKHREPLPVGPHLRVKEESAYCGYCGKCFGNVNIDDEGYCGQCRYELSAGLG